MENKGPYRESPEKPEKAEWEKHPVYLADMGGICGAAPRLKCQYCGGSDYELFYGHCRECADAKSVPRRTAEPQEFHDTLNHGGMTVVKGIPEGFGQKKQRPKKQYPWWHWRRWFSKK